MLEGLIGLTMQPSVLLIVTGFFLAAAFPHVLVRLRRQNWKASRAQFLLGLVPIALFARGLAFHVYCCEAYRRFDADLGGPPVNPLVNFLVSSVDLTILFTIVFVVSWLWLGSTRKQPVFDRPRDDAEC